MMMNSDHHARAHVISSPQYNPQTIMNYYSCGVETGTCTNPHVKNKPKFRNLDSFYQMGGSKINKSKKKSKSFSNFDHVAGSPKIQVCKKPAKKSESFSSFDHVGSPKIQVRKRPVKEAGSFSCVDRPQKKIRIEGVESLDFDQKSDKDSSICESRMKNEVFLCNRPMKQSKIQKLILWRGGVLRSLIENNIVERGSTVSYLCRKDGRVMKKGRVYEDGIKCDCCDHMFLLTKFELHAGSTNHRPAANLFFDDKRSILDCQTQLQLESMWGELLLCDSCTSSFHSTCIGLDCVPDSDLWFCPACVCQICHQGQPSNLTKEGDSKDNDLIKCAQCEHHFHISCINKLGFQVCADYAKWLCTEHCERIYLGLMEIRGKVIPLKGNNLNWSLLKYDENDTDVYELTKSYSKLIKALDVMHECFIPMKHPLSDKDIIEDVIFSIATKRSKF
ncbi:zinc finger, RING/FYVE/PHD-type, acyl-CoA N-acyltransferase, Jas TPL-binding domain protein [Tanacetum coccineum]